MERKRCERCIAVEESEAAATAPHVGQDQSPFLSSKMIAGGVMISVHGLEINRNIKNNARTDAHGKENGYVKEVAKSTAKQTPLTEGALQGLNWQVKTTENSFSQDGGREIVEGDKPIGKDNEGLIMVDITRIDSAHCKG